MDKGAYGATVHGGHKESDMTEWLIFHFMGLTEDDWGKNLNEDWKIQNIISKNCRTTIKGVTYM